MERLLLDLVNNIIPSIIVFVVGVIFLYGVKGINVISKDSEIMNAISTIANNESLRAIAKNLCIYAEKYVSKVAIEKLNYAVEQLELYCKQSGIKITKDQVLEIVQNTYDENKEEINKNEFVKDLKKIFDDKNNEELRDKK